MRAREKYDEAGALLERKIATARKQADKHLLRFLAASQYYHGGNYPKALELCKPIEQRLLPSEVRELYPKFLRDVRTRADADYAPQLRRKITNLVKGNQHAQILELLQHHPYALHPQRMAFARAVSCEELKQYQAAAEFYADVVRWTPAEPAVFLTAAAVPLYLSREGRLEEAWDYVQYQLGTIPHAVTSLTAALICYRRASAADGEERRRLYEEQLRHFNGAWHAFLALPAGQANPPEIRSLMAWALQTAAFALLRLGDRNRAQEICNQAIRFDPHSPNPWEVRGIVTYPSEAAVADFQKAISLGEKSYFPHYSLAHSALTKKDFRSAWLFCQQALSAEGKPGAQVEAQLYGWSAICRAASGADSDEIERLFRRGLEIDPENTEVKYNFRLYRNTESGEMSGNELAWTLSHTQCSDDQITLDSDASLRAAFKSRDLVQNAFEAA